MLEGLKGEPQEIKFHVFFFQMEDNVGKTHEIWAYGIDSIMSDATPDMSILRSLFPHVPSSAFMSLDQKEVDILIGINFFSLHPSGGHKEDEV